VPETKGKTMRALTRQDFERYRERRRRAGSTGERPLDRVAGDRAPA